MSDLNETAAMRTFRLPVTCRRWSGDTLGAGGVNLFVADGEVAFQDVPHFHVHVIPLLPERRFRTDLPEELH